MAKETEEEDDDETIKRGLLPTSVMPSSSSSFAIFDRCRQKRLALKKVANEGARTQHSPMAKETEEEDDDEND